MKRIGVFFLFLLTLAGTAFCQSPPLVLYPTHSAQGTDGVVSFFIDVAQPESTISIGSATLKYGSSISGPMGTTVPLSSISEMENTYWGSATLSSSIYYYHKVITTAGCTATESPKNTSDSWTPSFDVQVQTADDPSGDGVSGYPEKLDILEIWHTYSDDYLYGMMKQATTDWEFSGGLFGPFYIWAVYVHNPASETECAYAFVYANVPGFVSTGISKITPPSTIENIGDIDAETSGQYLYMRGHWSDLTSDPDFGTWPNSFGYLDVGGYTVNATLSEQVTVDTTLPAKFYPRTHSLSIPFSNTAPTLAGGGFDVLPAKDEEEIPCRFYVTYTDADENFPTVRQLVIGENVYNLASIDHNFSDGAAFQGDVPAPEETFEYFFRFCDGADTVETHPALYVRQALLNIANNMLILLPNSPNPFNSETRIRFIHNGNIPATGNIELYNTKGERIRLISLDRIIPGENSVTVSFNGLPTGIYLYRVNMGPYSKTGKLLFVK